MKSGRARKIRNSAAWIGERTLTHSASRKNRSIGVRGATSCHATKPNTGDREDGGDVEDDGARAAGHAAVAEPLARHRREHRHAHRRERQVPHGKPERAEAGHDPLQQRIHRGMRAHRRDDAGEDVAAQKVVRGRREQAATPAASRIGTPKYIV